MSAWFSPAPEPGGRKRRGFVVAAVAAAALVLAGGTATALTLTGSRHPANNAAASLDRSARGSAAASATPSYPVAGKAQPTTSPAEARSKAAAPGSRRTSAASPSVSAANPARSGALSTSPAANPVSSASSPASAPVSSTPTSGTTLYVDGSLDLVQNFGDPISAGASILGGTAPYSWTITGLPAGVTPQGNSGATVAYVGTAAAAGAYPFTVTIRDSSQPAQTVTEHYEYVALAPNSEGWSLGGLNLTVTLHVGDSYSAVVTKVGTAASSTPVSFSVLPGGLPPGLSINSATGAITGTATTVGTHYAWILGTDTATGAQRCIVVTFYVQA